MKEQQTSLTLQDAEQLCRLYMECRLSVLEETELRYVLQKLPYCSPSIDDARLLMGITIAAPSEVKAAPRRRTRRLLWAAAAAACVAVLFSAKAFFTPAPAEHRCVAYIHGRMYTGERAEAELQKNLAATEAFIQRLEAVTAEQNQRIEYILNHKNPSL